MELETNDELGNAPNQSRAVSVAVWSLSVCSKIALSHKRVSGPLLCSHFDYCDLPRYFTRASAGYRHRHTVFQQGPQFKKRRKPSSRHPKCLGSFNTGYRRRHHFPSRNSRLAQRKSYAAHFTLHSGLRSANLQDCQGL